MTSHLPQFVIARRMVGDRWPVKGKESVAIRKAQRDYEDGLVEMAQRREGRIVYQYAIPRKKPGMVRPRYFDTPCR